MKNPQMGGCEAGGQSSAAGWLTRSVRGWHTGEIPTCPRDVFRLWWHLGAHQMALESPPRFGVCSRLSRLPRRLETWAV